MYASHIDWLNVVKDELRRQTLFVSHGKPHLTTISLCLTTPAVVTTQPFHEWLCQTSIPQLDASLQRNA